jgi:hypothetical protein
MLDELDGEAGWEDEEEPNGGGMLVTVWRGIRRNPEPLAGFGIGFIVIGFLQIFGDKDLFVMPLYFLLTFFSFWLWVLSEQGQITPPAVRHRRRTPPPDLPTHRIV